MSIFIQQKENIKSKTQKVITNFNNHKLLNQKMKNALNQKIVHSNKIKL